jgi:hypothetical protein
LFFTTISGLPCYNASIYCNKMGTEVEEVYL